MVRRNTRSVGSDAESLARHYLECRGLTVLTANFQSRLGELDLVLTDGDGLIIAEVRRRGADSLVPAAHTVDRHKQIKIIRTTALFLARRPEFAEYSVRFDVLGIDVDRDGGETIEWIQDAFRPADASL